METHEVLSEQGLEILVNSLLQLAVEHDKILGSLLKVKNLQLSHDEVQIVD